MAGELIHHMNPMQLRVTHKKLLFVHEEGILNRCHNH